MSRVGSLTPVTYADQFTTAYTYDAGDRLPQIVDSIGGRSRGPTTSAIADVGDDPEGAISYTVRSRAISGNVLRCTHLHTDHHR
jgi:YD repeat-containing protein